MATLTGQSIASSYEQLLHVDADGGGNSTTHVSVKDGDNGTTFALTLATDAVMITSDNRLEFGDDGTYIHQSADGVLDLVSDTEIELNGTIDINGAVTMDGGNVTINDDSGNYDFRVETDSETHTLFTEGSSGNVMFGTSTVTGTDTGSGILAGGASFVPNSVGRTILYLGSVNHTSAIDIARFYNQNGKVGGISTDASATAFNTSSDYRLKENEVPISDGIERLNQLKPYRFNFKTDADKTVDGFFAHEVSDIVPEAITGEKDAVDDDGNPIYQGIDQSKIVPLLVAAIQELSAKVEALEG